MSPELEIQLLAVVVAAACALPGVFLVLRGMAMMSDAISHSILPGIVLAFFAVGNLNSPWLIAGAAVMGLVTVVLVEILTATRLVKEDAAIGLVFPALFSVGVILIAQFAGDVHLDLDAVLLGEIAFAPFNRLELAGMDLAPQSLIMMAGVGLVNLLFITLFYKELKLATFDAALATALGFAPAVLHYLLMGIVSVTAVAAFDAVGAILVVALFVGPPAAAHLLSDRLSTMLLLSVLLGAASALTGYWLAYLIDASIAGAMATMVGVFFAAAYLLAPSRGLIATLRRRRRQRWQFAIEMLTIHLLHHEGTPEAADEAQVDHLTDHMAWEEDFAGGVVERARSRGVVRQQGTRLLLTAEGRSLAREVIRRS